ncbi:MAG: DUF1643 domain-containing protein [Dechloromonas sp.]|nr:DUF1643 domain-containing protein [Dechloromonas sp.]
MSLNDLFCKSGAQFSACNRYRYRLWRIWDESRKPLVMVMLNPSMANADQNDPTVERCQRRALKMGFGGLRVVNIFALVSTDPAALYQVDDPVGPDNDAAILEAVRDAGMVICAWGTHGAHVDRAREVVALLRQAGVSPYCLAINGDKSPKHPLYIALKSTPVAYELD